MAGIYLHIPFCRQACHYCNFHFSTSLRYKPEVITALLQEMALQKNYLAGQPVQTVYFGGGTPSLLTGEEIHLLLHTLQQNFAVAPDAEITLEANPDDITSEKLASWKLSGINRLSIGVQSFAEEELRWMNRAHNAAQAKACIEQSLEAGFTNISIDLIYGSPLLSDAQWEENVATAIQLGVPHLSCYALTVEEKTPLHKQIYLQQKKAVDEEQQARQFSMLMRWLKAAGYEHYEVSNFAKPGLRSRHNSSYWKGEHYLGLGPSAHSYNGASRQWNVANNNQYIASLQGGMVPKEIENLTPQQKLNEYIMISLRTAEGMNLEHIKNNWNAAAAEVIAKRLTRFSHENLITQHQSTVQLTEKGMFMADGIASDLFDAKV